MKIQSQEEIKTTHHIVVENGYTIHRREKLAYDFKKKDWIRKHLIWERSHSSIDRNVKLPSSKQLEREFQLNKLLD
jgi:hypothetical protein